MSKWQIIMLVLCSGFTAQGATWQQVWSDEFDYTGLPDSMRWDYEVGMVRNNEEQFYTRARLENARVEDGMLIIEARREPWHSAQYTSASLITAGHAHWTYGRWEIRAMLPGGRGTWPAIWTLGTSIGEVGWPACGEIDILENVGFDPSRVYGNIHVEAYNHAIGTGKGNSILVTEPWNRFYTYAIEWYEDRIDFFVDDHLHWTYHNEGTGPAVWPFDSPQYLLLCLAIGGSWGGQQGIDTTLFPARMYIDYVRIYQQSRPGPYGLHVSARGKGSVVLSHVQEQYDSGTVVTLEAHPFSGYVFAGWGGDTTASDNPIAITMVRDRELFARFVKPGEMLRNGTFDVDMTWWYFWKSHDSVQAAVRVADGASVVEVTRPATYDWEVQIGQSGLALEQGAGYTIALDAYADRERHMTLAIRESVSPWRTVYQTRIALGTVSTEYELSFVVTELPPPDSRIECDFGDEAGTVYLHNISLIRTDATGSPPSPLYLSPVLEQGSRGYRQRFDLGGRVQQLTPGLHPRTITVQESGLVLPAMGAPGKKRP